MKDENNQESASLKEKFDLSFNMLKDYHNVFMDSLFKSLE
ncbi:MAG: hypothetical protein JWQ38_1735 [Flavipsychrobacter sp.]|nr:hypothetical protein [Flavipsychrobacter sp.]